MLTTTSTALSDVALKALLILLIISLQNELVFFHLKVQYYITITEHTSITKHHRIINYRRITKHHPHHPITNFWNCFRVGFGLV